MNEPAKVFHNPFTEAGLCRELREKRLADMERSRAGHRQKLLERWCGSSNEEQFYIHPRKMNGWNRKIT